MLNRIRVKNFKSFKDLDYSCAKLNLLTGVNGAGKSSFVQLLLLLRAISAKDLSLEVMKVSDAGFTGKHADLKYCYAKGDDDIECEFECTPRTTLGTQYGGDRKSDYLQDLEWDLALKGCQMNEREIHEIREKVSWIIRPSNRDVDSMLIMHPMWRDRYLNSDIYADFIASYDRQFTCSDTEDEICPEIEKKIEIRKKVAELRNTIKSEIMNNLGEKRKWIGEVWENMRMVSAFRIKPREVHNAGYVAGRFNPEGDDVIEYLYMYGHKFSLGSKNPMRHRTTKSQGRSFLIDEVNAWLGEVSTGARINIKSESVGDEQKFVEAIDYGEGKLQRAFKPQNVGFGVSYILPVLVTVLTSHPEDIVVIENPEAHLHPRGQSEMGRLIACAAAYGVQLFVETHSDHVINGVRVAIKEGVIKPDEAKVAFFERSKHTVPSEDGKDSVEVYSSERDILIDENGALSEYPTDFLDEWNNQLMELM